MGKWGGRKLLTSCCPAGGKLNARRDRRVRELSLVTYQPPSTFSWQWQEVKKKEKQGKRRQIWGMGNWLDFFFSSFPIEYVFQFMCGIQ